MKGEIDVHISLGREVLRGNVNDGIEREREKESKGWHYFSIQPQVRKISYCSGNRRDLDTAA